MFRAGRIILRKCRRSPDSFGRKVYYSNFLFITLILAGRCSNAGCAHWDDALARDFAEFDAPLVERVDPLEAFLNGCG